MTTVFYTLHPTPYTLHPTLHTSHPTPYTLQAVVLEENIADHGLIGGVMDSWESEVKTLLLLYSRYRS